jgi:thiosulfate/3-mercaptopyruvate sulfurtransferase
MSTLEMNTSLVSVDWLKENLNHSELTVIDASWFMPGQERNGREEWLSERIPNAIYFDFDQHIYETDTDQPHMLPSKAFFSEQVGLLGIGDQDKIVVYDSQGIFSAPRVWWMFKAMGHKEVAVLDGGLPAWKSAHGALEVSAPIAISPVIYQASEMPQWNADIDSVHAEIGNSNTAIIDARGVERFLGQQEEPRPNVRRGRIPGSKNLPFAEILEDGHMKPISYLKARFDDVCDDSQSLIFSCGSGVTACILALAATQLGKEKLAVYDGSWTEWGSRHEYPVE